MQNNFGAWLTGKTPKWFLTKSAKTMMKYAASGANKHTMSALGARKSNPSHCLVLKGELRCL
jgi:hypothetical protein